MLSHRATFCTILVCLLSTALALAGTDLNNSGDMDPGDLKVLVDCWMKAQHNEPGWEQADVEPDGDLDLDDVRAVIEAFITQYVPSIHLADYMPAAAGDLRLWQRPGEGGVIWAQEQMTEAGLGGGALKDCLRTVFNQDLTLVAWLVDDAKIVGVAGFYWDGTFYEAKHDGQPVLFPETLQLNQERELWFHTYRNGVDCGQGHVRITLEGTDQTISTPAGTFAGCARVKMTFGWDDGQVYHIIPWTFWLAPGFGPVKRTDYVGEALTSEIVYAKAGGQEHGQRPTIDLAGTVPCAVGTLHAFGLGTEVWGFKVTIQLPVGDVRAALFDDLALPLTSSGTYWSCATDAVTGFAGWRTPEEGSFVFEPAFAWPDRMKLGELSDGQGNVAHGFDHNYGTYTASVALAGANQTVATPAGTFSGCYVLAIAIRASRASGQALWDMTEMLWIKPGVGPIQIGEFEEPQPPVPTYPTVVSQSLYARAGGHEHGTRPTFDFGDALKLAAGNSWRLTHGDHWEVRSVAGQAQIDGHNAWRVVHAESGGDGLLDEISSDLYRLAPNYVSIEGYESDPDEFDEPLLLIPSAPVQVPRPMLFGELYSYVRDVLRADTRQKLGSVQLDLLYSGNRDVTVPAGTFGGAAELQCRTRETLNGQTEIDTERLYYDAAAGLVQWVECEPAAGQEHRWNAEWISVGGRGWNHPGSFDISTYYPLATGNQWRYGSPARYMQLQVDQQTAVGGYDSAYPVRCLWDSTLPGEQDVYYRVLQGPAMLLVAWKPCDYPHIVLYRDAVEWKRPWEIGSVARIETVLTDPTQPGVPPVPAWDTAIPVASGLVVDTPAGRFVNCVRLVRLRICDATAVGIGFTWEHWDVVLAPDVGAVLIHERDNEDDWYDGPGPLFWAVVNGQHYGHP